MQVVIGGQPVEEQTPQLLEGAGAFGSPPEPAARGFMQRAPQNRNVVGGNLLQLHGDRINVAQDEGIFNRIGVGQRRRDVKCRRCGVKATPPRFAGGVKEIGGSVPVPAEPQYVAGALEGNIAFRVVCRHAAVLHAAGRVIDQVALHNRRFASGLPLNIADLGRIVLAGPGVLAVVRHQRFHQHQRGEGGLSIHQRGRHRSGWRWRRHRIKINAVDFVPVPATADLKRIGTRQYFDQTGVETGESAVGGKHAGESVPID